uniref:Cytochrome c domain-containing protein n=1 Tax=Phenylobacterium glaciei TaxID=2803784 RepID=A0A974P2E4_9CAUL|nr:hypothetical protein JKL49_25640 [Phenylobacterium glaciei]
MPVAAARPARPSVGRDRPRRLPHADRAGGQAARAGVACETCHRSGRSNPDFLFPGVSGPPGSADVTSSLFSSHRGDGIDDPVPIPDLSGPRAGLKVAPADLPPSSTAWSPRSSMDPSRRPPCWRA